LRSEDEKGLILIDILIVILIAGIIAAIVVPQYAQKKEEERIALSRRNMISLADAQDRFFEVNGRFASDIEELASVAPEVSDLVSPEGELGYVIEIPDSLSYVITSTLGHGDVRADTTERKLSWEK